MKIRTRVFCTVLIFLMLLASLSLPVFAAKTSVTAVVATSDLDEIAVLYGRAEKLAFTVTEGEPVRFNQSWVTCWEKYNVEDAKWEKYSGRFYPGTYRVSAQLRIDGEDAKTHELATNVTCTVDGIEWALDPVSQHGTFSCVFATSPEIVILDDPNVTEPVDVTNAYFNMTGYVAGRDFSNISFYPTLGTEEKIDIVQPSVFVDMTDANGDGIPDSMDIENKTYAPATGEIKANTEYMLTFTFKAKDGYDLYGLELADVNLPCKKGSIPGVDFLGGYNEENDTYNVLYLLLPAVNEGSFIESPVDPVGYYRNGEGELVLSWAVAGEVGGYMISRYDEEYEDWNIYSNVFTTSFTFSYMGEAQTDLYRIEAIKSGNAIAISDPFRITWQEMKPVTLPIRIDASAAAGSKVPMDLTKFYPVSDQYAFVTAGEGNFNCFIDGETGDPATQFENGKEYGYIVSVVAKPGYYFKDKKNFWGTPDSVRIYGIGWEQVMNVMIGSDAQFDAIFTFTYNEEMGIPAEQEKLLSELVFDASSLVGAPATARIPDDVFAHGALTPCGTYCACTKMDSEAKASANVWMQVGEGTPPTAATAFVSGKGYTYMLYFHVADGWSVPGVLNHFDFVLSGTGLEAVDVVYQSDLQMLGIRLGFRCENENGIPAGAHTCQRNAVAAKTATCTENGNPAHYACYCGKTYKDKWGMYEIADLLNNNALAATGHTFTEAWLTDAEGHWRECACGEREQVGAHTDNNENGSCDICGAVLAQQESGLPTGAIVAIVIGAVILLSVGGFALYWFVLRKKNIPAPAAAPEAKAKPEETPEEKTDDSDKDV